MCQLQCLISTHTYLSSYHIMFVCAVMLSYLSSMVNISFDRMFGLYFALLAFGSVVGAQRRNGYKCETPKCELKPFDLRFWYEGVEIDLRQIVINEADDMIITCDGSCVGLSGNPRLSWYGPNLRRIEEKSNNRTYSEKSLSGHFSRLVLHDVTSNMSGRYTCRGWLGQIIGWRKKEINIAVVAVRSNNREVTQKMTLPVDGTSLAVRSNNREVTQKMTLPVDGTSHVNISSKFSCTSGKMIDAKKVCDGFPDCESGDDESNCDLRLICSEGTIACADNQKCIPRDQICDSVVQCRDGSDELPNACNN